MENIIITRKRSIAAFLAKYYCVLNLDKEKFQEQIGLRDTLSLGYRNQFLNESTQTFPIANGETISIEISEKKNTLFVVAFTLGGNIFSNEITFNKGSLDLSYSIKTKLGFTSNTLILSKV